LTARKKAKPVSLPLPPSLPPQPRHSLPLRLQLLMLKRSSLKLRWKSSRCVQRKAAASSVEANAGNAEKALIS